MAALAVGLLVSCATLPDGGRSAAAPVLGGERPANYWLPPETADPDAPPAGLLLLLHGYGSFSEQTLRIWYPLQQVVTRAGLILIAPDGLENPAGLQYWNASDYCCDFEPTGVDDVAYLSGLIAEAREHFPVDPQRIYVMGFSNGGFMAHRLACERSDLITAIVDIAGAGSLDEGVCTAFNPDPVSVLQIHGTADETILYNGEAPEAPSEDDPEGSAGYPGVAEDARRWARINGCPAPPTPGGDVANFVRGAGRTDTSIARSGECTAGTRVETWTLEAVGHVPFFNRRWAASVVSWLEHPESAR